MKHSISKFAYVLQTILSGDKKQALAILVTLNANQIQLISEIIYNLLQIPQSVTVSRLLKRNKKIINRIGNPKLNPLKRLRLTRKHNKLILKVLYSVKKQLLDLVKDG